MCFFRNVLHVTVPTIPHLATVTSVVTSFGSAALVDGLHDVVDGSHGGHGGDRKSERHRGGAMALFSASAREVGMRNTQKHTETRFNWRLPGFNHS